MSRRPSLPRASSACKSFCRCTQLASRCNSSDHSVRYMARGRAKARQKSHTRSGGRSDSAGSSTKGSDLVEPMAFPKQFLTDEGKRTATTGLGYITLTCKVRKAHCRRLPVALSRRRMAVALASGTLPLSDYDSPRRKAVGTCWKVRCHTSRRGKGI
jgi:hypothetical protein